MEESEVSHSPIPLTLSVPLTSPKPSTPPHSNSEIVPSDPTRPISTHGTMSWVNLAMVVYFSIGGGPFGFEESILVSNPAWALWSLLVVALLWALPQSMTMAELSVRYEGGYNEWVFKAFGFHVGLFHSIVRTVFNVACNAGYIALYYDYINSIYHQTLFFDYEDVSMTYFLLKIPTIVMFLCLLVTVNVIGAKQLSTVGIFLTVGVILPFIVCFFIATPHLDLSQLVNFTVVSEDSSFPKLVSIIMFNLMGWDFVGNVSSQAKKPKRDVPVAMVVALVLVVLTYTVPTMDLVTTLDFTQPPSVPGSPYSSLEPLYSSMAKKLWKPLSYVITVATILGVFGLASMFLQTSSQALSHATQFNFLPRVFSLTFAGTNTPYFAILFQTVFAGFISIFVTFNQIVSVQMWFLSVSTLFIMVAYLAIRWKAYLKKRDVEALFYLPFHPVLLTLFVTPTILLSIFQLLYKVGEWYVIAIGAATLVVCEGITLVVVYCQKRNSTIVTIGDSPSPIPTFTDIGVISPKPQAEIN
ncbi:amino acid transporter, putative [Entamoeba invadens IP1]|uniref:Amino acid transporter, putative n=1 Tax=Entamoeba invadens IP1 TaxID=370355 RepID=A0A0A1U4J1_ENTIV|nr:amino acid transporter, putative [Entamoeba invadens IP1]ELP87786.1 amino acid transporter, putative [Entamoeba invadens IP1]|eukprot:XP_004254557.1 amino acid transporter, putative [Entamoeba invadens IP1]